MSQPYCLLDSDTDNLIGAYDTEVEALRVVADVAHRYGPMSPAATSLVLVQSEMSTILASGWSLVQKAYASEPLPAIWTGEVVSDNFTHTFLASESRNMTTRRIVQIWSSPHCLEPGHIPVERLSRRMFCSQHALFLGYQFDTPEQTMQARIETTQGQPDGVDRGLEFTHWADAMQWLDGGV